MKRKKMVAFELGSIPYADSGFIYLLFNNYIPMTFTIVIAFKKYNFQKGIWGSEFIGFDNFKSLFSTRGFLDYTTQYGGVQSYFL